MKKITCLSLFPKMISDALAYGVIGRQTDIEIESLDLRNWGIGDYQRVDEPIFGPGVGMLLRPDVLSNAVDQIKTPDSFVIHMSPRGQKLTNQLVKQFACKEHLIIVASRYEGADERFLQTRVDLEVSIGDFVLTGGELAIAVLIDSVMRMTGHVIQSEATENESFENGLLEYPQYTKPIEFENLSVPSYLRSGNHQLIDEKQFIQKLFKTWVIRKDLFREYPMCHITVDSKNPLTKIKKQNALLKKRLAAFEKVIQEYKDVRRTQNSC